MEWATPSWYHAHVDRLKAENLLAGKRLGLFLVRDSSTYPGDYVLSVNEHEKVIHYRISKEGHLYVLGKQPFDDLPSVIEFYKENLLSTIKLSEAVPKLTVQSVTTETQHYHTPPSQTNPIPAVPSSQANLIPAVPPSQANPISVVPPSQANSIPVRKLVTDSMSIEGQCLHAFFKEEKEEVLRLLPKLSRPNEISDDLGRTLLHLAAKCGWDKICILLIEKYDCDPKVADTLGHFDRTGRTPLHYACEGNHLSVIAILLSTTSFKLTDVHGMIGHAPFRDLPKDFPTLSRIASLMKDWSTEVPVSPLFKIFMTGNSAAGKSSLTRVIEELASYIPSQHGRVSGVKPLTAGVHTIQCTRSELDLRRNKSILGYVYDSEVTDTVPLSTEIEIYDLAGHPEYYSSHAAILEVVTLESPAVFVIIVDLTKRKTQIAKELYSWSNFLKTQSGRISSHLIVVGSRKDKFLIRSHLEKKCAYVKATAISAFKEQHFAGFMALDCRRLSSKNIEPFLMLLKKSIEKLTKGKSYGNMSFQSHLLHTFLRQKFKAKAISFHSLHEQISLEGVLAPLSDPETLASTLEILTDKGMVLFVRDNNDLASSCVVIDKQALLLEITGVLFAPRFFKEYFPIASNTGIVPVSLLLEKFPYYDHKILVPILTSLQFCHSVQQVLLDSLSTNLSPRFATSEQLLYFPALNTVDRPGNTSITRGYGWSIYCTDPHQCLTRHYLHKLMHKLAYTYCLSQPPSPKLEHSVVQELNRTCTVWRNGIHWTTANGTQAMVQVTEEYRSVSLLVSANKDFPRKSLELRSSLVATILSFHQKQCPSVDIKEYLVSPLHLHRLPRADLFELTVFSMKDVARAVVHRETIVPAVSRKKKDEIKLESLLPSDPYHVLPLKVVQQLFDDSVSNHPVAASMLEEIRDHCKDILIPVNPTHESMQEHLNKLSIFAGRNPLKLAGVTDVLSTIDTPTFPGGYVNEYYEVPKAMSGAVFQGRVRGFTVSQQRVGAISSTSNHVLPIPQATSATDRSGPKVTDTDHLSPLTPSSTTDNLQEKALDHVPLIPQAASATDKSGPRMTDVDQSPPSAQPVANERLPEKDLFEKRNFLELAGVTAADLPPPLPPNTTDGAPPTKPTPTFPGGFVHIEHYEVHTCNMMRDAVIQGPVGGFAAPGGGIGAASLTNNHAQPIPEAACITDRSGSRVTDADQPPTSPSPTITHSPLEKALDTSYLLEVGLSLRGLERWQDLGLALGLDYLDLENIDEKKGGDMDKCRTAMLHSWLQTGTATKSSLIAALYQMGEASFATNIH